jgi:hypothetical protein
MEQITNWNKFQIGTNFENGTTFKLEQISKMEQITSEPTRRFLEAETEKIRTLVHRIALNGLRPK